MWPMSAVVQSVLASSHTINLRATAYTASGGVQPNLPLAGGEVKIDGTSQVRRTATVTIADVSLWPKNPLDILTPLGSELLVEYGIVVPGQGTTWVPVIRGGINDATRDLPVQNGMPLTINDRSALVAEDRLLAPGQVGGGTTTVVQAITSLVQDAFPGVVVVDKTGSSTVAAVLDIDKDRWEACEKLADSIGCEVFFDASGQLVVRPQPTLADPQVWVVSAGNGGIMVSRNDKQTRDLVYNAVVVSGQRTDGTAPVTTIVYDTDSGSPTYWGGAFGKKPRFYSSPLITTTGQATTAGQALLERVRGMQANVSLTAVCNPALEAGDVIRVIGTAWEAHILDGVTVPLDAHTAQHLTTRSKVLPSEAV